MGFIVITLKLGQRLGIAGSELWVEKAGGSSEIRICVDALDGHRVYRRSTYGPEETDRHTYLASLEEHRTSKREAKLQKH